MGSAPAVAAAAAVAAAVAVAVAVAVRTSFNTTTTAAYTRTGLACAEAQSIWRGLLVPVCTCDFAPRCCAAPQARHQRLCHTSRCPTNSADREHLFKLALSDVGPWAATLVRRGDGFKPNTMDTHKAALAHLESCYPELTFVTWFINGAGTPHRPTSNT